LRSLQGWGDATEIEALTAEASRNHWVDAMMESWMAPGPPRPPKRPPKEPLIKTPGNGAPDPQDRKPPDPDETPEIKIPPGPLRRPPIIPPDVPERRLTGPIRAEDEKKRGCAIPRSLLKAGPC
jgi:hypothetical protein